MKSLTILALLTALASASTINYQPACFAKNPAVINAIGIFCQNNDLVIPSDAATNGQNGHVGNSWAFISITGICTPPQWVPPKFCISQFQEICAKGDQNGAGVQTFGWNNGCQTWKITNGQSDPSGGGGWGWP